MVRTKKNKKFIKSFQVRLLKLTTSLKSNTKATDTEFPRRVNRRIGRAFFSFEFEEISVDKSKTLERTSQRMFVPLRGVETMSWRNFVIHVTRCEDQGPPHDNTAPVEFYVEERQTKVK